MRKQSSQNSPLAKASSALALFALAAISVSAQSTSAVSITLSPGSAHTSPIPTDFAGLSLEMDTVRSDWNGGTNVHVGWLGGQVTAYSTMLKTLGVHSLRIGGNSAEGGSYAYPTELDATHADDFCNLIGANLIWTLPVESRYNVSTYSSYAQFMINDQRSKSFTYQTVFAIGNEPDLNGVDQPTYQSRFDAYFNSLRSGIGSGLKVAGSGASNNTTYSNDLSHDTTYSGTNHANIGFITLHSYPEGGAGSYPSIDAAIDKMLSSGNDANYLSSYNGWGPTAVNAGFAPRLEETNSMYGGGFVGASNTFAASLWALDYLGYLSSATGLAGVNFHTGNTSNLSGGAYNPIDPVGLASSYTLEGVGYGMLAFHQYANGKVVPLTVSATPSINLTAYAVLQSDSSESVSIINRTHTSSTATSVDATVTVNPGKTFGHAQVMYLNVTNSDPTLSSGITLGGQGVTSSGAWAGGFTQTLTPNGGNFTIAVPHTSAAIVHFY